VFVLCKGKKDEFMPGFVQNPPLLFFCWFETYNCVVIVMRVAFFGTPDYAIPVLDRLVAGQYNIVGVWTRADRPMGRGRRLGAPPMKIYAEEHGLPLFQPETLREDSAVEEIRSSEPDVIIVAGYGRILPQKVLSVPPKGALNIHPSLLPKYRGPSPVVTAILSGETVTGVTVMLIDQGMDTGEILAQREVRILSNETAGDLTKRLFDIGAQMIEDVLPAWMIGGILPVPQKEDQATTTCRYTKQDGEIHWSLPAIEIERQLRAFRSWPGSYTYWEGKLLRVLAGVALAPGEFSGENPGKVVVEPRDGGKVVSVVTSQGLLELTEVQIEGRKEQTIQEMVRGYPKFLVARLPS
jgi:methionyl-tRNA formyltransferase